MPTATFGVLFGFLVLAHHRRRVVHFSVTTHPTAELTARQLIQAVPEEMTPRFLVRDRDKTYGARFRRVVEILGIEEVVTAARSPWQNPYAEHRSVHWLEFGKVIEFPQVGGLHHRYARVVA